MNISYNFKSTILLTTFVLSYNLFAAGQGDPLVNLAWYLKNNGPDQETYATCKSKDNDHKIDLNIQKYIDTYAGKGIKVNVSDSGIDMKHRDLWKNINKEESINFACLYGSRNGTESSCRDVTPDPAYQKEGDHGTGVSGIIGAMRDNGIGSHGIAYKAILAGYAWLSDKVRKTVPSYYQKNIYVKQFEGDFNVFNYSWGNNPSKGNQPATKETQDLLWGAVNRRVHKGIGPIYVQAAGNDFDSNFSVQMNMNQQFPYTINVGALNNTGIKSSYSSVGSSLWISAPGGEFGQNADLYYKETYDSHLTTHPEFCQEEYPFFLEHCFLSQKAVCKDYENNCLATVWGRKVEDCIHAEQYFKYHCSQIPRSNLKLCKILYNKYRTICTHHNKSKQYTKCKNEYAEFKSSCIKSDTARCQSFMSNCSYDKEKACHISAFYPAILTTDQSGCKYGYATDDTPIYIFNQLREKQLPSKCDFTANFNGTSSATPMVVGSTASILEAAASRGIKLNWRKIKYLLARNASKVRYVPIFPKTYPRDKQTGSPILPDNYEYEQDWINNHGQPSPFSFHNYFGFGAVNVDKTIDMILDNSDLFRGKFLGTYAETNKNFISDCDKNSFQTQYPDDSNACDYKNISIPDNDAYGVTDTINISTESITHVEAVQVLIWVTHQRSSDIGVELTSPSGTKSIMLYINNSFTSPHLSKMLLLSNAFYGEPVNGQWTIKLIDGRKEIEGTLDDWKINIVGGNWSEDLHQL